jgi:DNA polymerase eta
LEVVLLTFLRSSPLGLLLKDGEERMTAGEWLCQRNASRDDQLLACGALIVAELRAAVLQETQFTCSAGIAHNKVLLTYELLFIVKKFAG